MLLSETQLASFHAEGFLIIPNAFDPTELHEFREALRQVIGAQCLRAGQSCRPGREFDDGVAALDAVDHRFVADIYDICAQLPEFWRLTSKRCIQGIINELLGRPAGAPLYGFTHRCRIDPPNDRRRTYGWHQETFYTIPRSEFIQTWAPLVRESTVANGTIEVCVGSHTAGIPPQTWSEAPGRAVQIIVEPDVVARYERRALEMQLGQLVLFSGRLFHRSGSNTSSEHRYSLVGMYHDINAVGFRPPHLRFVYQDIAPRAWYEDLARDWPCARPMRHLPPAVSV